MIETVVIRHPKERLSKCSLEPLRDRPEITFYKARPGFTFDATGYILLHTEGEELGGKNPFSVERATDAASAPKFLLLDSTWRLLPQLEACVIGEPIRCRLPDGVRTAYPRVSKIADDPTGGLASVEALYLARRLLGDDDPSLLDHYHWRDAFLQNLQGIV